MTETFLLQYFFVLGVAVVLTTPAVRQPFIRFSKWIDRLCGVAFILLAGKLALSKAS